MRLFEEIGANLVTLAVSCIPFIIVFRAERKRPFSKWGAIAAAVMFAIILYTFLPKDWLGLLSGTLTFCPVAYYAAARFTRGKG